MDTSWRFGGGSAGILLYICMKYTMLVREVEEDISRNFDRQDDE